MIKHQVKIDKIEPKWKQYAALFTKKNEDALNKIRAVSEYCERILKQARRRQAQYEKKKQKLIRLKTNIPPLSVPKRVNPTSGQVLRMEVLLLIL